MRKLFTALLVTSISVISFAQDFDMKINAGANATHLSDFKSEVLVGKDLPIDPTSSFFSQGQKLSLGGVESVTNYKIGFAVDAELGKIFWNGWRLSISIGVNQMAYSYDTKLPANSIFTTDTSLRQMISDYGDSKLLYISSRFANVSKSFGRVSLQAGPIFNYLINKKYNNAYTSMNASDPAKYNLIKESKGDANKFLYGGHFNIRYKILKPLELMIGTQYYFNSIYQKDGTYENMYKKGKPLQLQLGLSYRIAYF